MKKSEQNIIFRCASTRHQNTSNWPKSLYRDPNVTPKKIIAALFFICIPGPTSCSGVVQWPPNDLVRSVRCNWNNFHLKPLTRSEGWTGPTRDDLWSTFHLVKPGILIALPLYLFQKLFFFPSKSWLTLNIAFLIW